uniref:DEAD/DEAH box helicase n=1 Tax=Cellulomonas endophytica TaxID=2494735 RepID=UPI0013E91743
MTSFATLGVPAALVRTLAADGIEQPFPIQTATLPDSLAGRDVLGRGRTGSGKTLAFALPVVARLAASGSRRQARRPRALVLCPTRELANQIDAVLAPLASAVGLTTATVFGGVAQSRQVAALDRGVDVLVACPGRLEDLLGQRLLTLDGVEVTVLDEADHMADLGFLPGVKRILDRTPAGTQRLLFSATLDNGVDVLVKRYLKDPVEHSVDSASSPVVAMTHHVLEVGDADAKKAIVHRLAGGTGRRVLFLRTKHQAKKLAKQLTAAGIPAVDLHGNLGQGARERNLAAFSTGSVNVLVATDIAARGIHVDEVGLVVHVDPPAEHKAYLHRSGRTARAGAGGDVVTLVLPEERADVRALTRAAKITARPQPVRPGDAVVERLAGEAAPFVEPAPAPEPVVARTGGGRSRGAGRGTGAAGTGAAPRTGAGRTGSASSCAPCAACGPGTRPSRPT